MFNATLWEVVALHHFGGSIGVVASTVSRAPTPPMKVWVQSIKDYLIIPIISHPPPREHTGWCAGEPRIVAVFSRVGHQGPRILPEVTNDPATLRRQRASPSCLPRAYPRRLSAFSVMLTH